MAVNSVTQGNMAAFQSQSSSSAVSSDKPAKGTSPSKDQPSNKTAQRVAPDTITNSNKISAPEKQTPQKTALELNANDTTDASVVPSHVLVTYNPQGKVRTKFLDSRNDVVYQVPPEMVARMEDLMMKPETSANIKG